MDGSYDSVFHQSTSSTPAVTPGTAGQYKANLNRTKTRKWVEAKTVDYGGDDWGGDYDDEPDEPESQPQPTPKPHGPRSSSTTFSNTQPPSPAGPRPLQTSGLAAQAPSPALNSNAGLKSPVGAPALHIQTQQHPATRPQVDSGSPWAQNPPSRGSTPGLEHSRAMSPQTVGVPQSVAAPNVYSTIAEFGHGYGDSRASPTIQAPFQGRGPRRMSPGPQRTSSPVPTRFPRRKSSLGQHDAPADSLYSPTHGERGAQSASRPGSSHTNASSIMSPNRPWVVEGTVGGPRSASPSGSMRSPITTGKPLPFVRPADIYKKLEEEKEKVRRSIDSGRPSMDSLGQGRGSETAGSLRTQSPARTSQNTRQAQEQGQVRPDSELMSHGLKGVTTEVPLTEEIKVEASGWNRTTQGRHDDETMVPRASRTGLPTVAERKSEYGIEGLIASYEAREGTSEDTSQPDTSPLANTAERTSAPATSEGVPAISPATSHTLPGSKMTEETGEQVNRATTTPGLSRTAGTIRNEPLESAHSDLKAGNEASRVEQVEGVKKEQTGEELRRLSTSPKLPELGRLSAFGFDLFSSSSASINPSTLSRSSNLPTSSHPPIPAIPPTHPNSVVQASSPLSIVIESPISPTPSLSPHNVGSVVEAYRQEAQAPGDKSRPEPGQQMASSQDSLPRQDHSGAGASSPVRSAGQISGGDHLQTQEHSDSAFQGLAHQDNSLNSEQSLVGHQGQSLVRDQRPAEASKGPQPGAEDLTNLHVGTQFFTSKSEHEPSISKALPTLPSEDSMVTPDSQASQLVISAPIANVTNHALSEAGGVNGSPTDNNKLAVHPLLAQQAEQARSIPHNVSTSTLDDTMLPQPHPISASGPSPAQGSKLTPVDNQVLPSPAFPGPLITDYENYLASGSSNDQAQQFVSVPHHNDNDDIDIEPTISTEELGRELSDDTFNPPTSTPSHPSTAPPPPPVEMTRGDTFVTAVESPSALSDRGSPTKSDTLSSEILRALTPKAPTGDAAADTPVRANLSPDVPSGAARESTFLPDLYDDYWSFAGTGNPDDANATPSSIPALSAMPAALNVSSHEARPRSFVVVNSDIQSSPVPSPAPATPRSSVDVFKSNVQALPVELHRPVLANRFSWERDGLEAAKIDVKVEPKSLADKPQTVAIVETEGSPVSPAVDTKLGDAADSPAPAYHDKGKAVIRSRSPSPSMTIQEATQTQSSSAPLVPPAIYDALPVSTPDTEAFGAHPGPLTSHPVKTFREIMEVPSQSDRIAEFNKARHHYAAAETGLETILEHLAVQHPDIVEASRAGGQPTQVYTNEVPSAQDMGGLLSPTTLGAAPPTASRHHSTSAHLGPKTKEFFATAGKASKGLFSTLKAKGKKVAN